MKLLIHISYFTDYLDCEDCMEKHGMDPYDLMEKYFTDIGLEVSQGMNVICDNPDGTPEYDYILMPPRCHKEFLEISKERGWEKYGAHIFSNIQTLINHYAGLSNENKEKVASTYQRYHEVLSDEEKEKIARAHERH